MNKPDPSLQRRESDNICGIEKDVAAGHSKMSCAHLTLYIIQPYLCTSLKQIPSSPPLTQKNQFSHEKMPFNFMPGFFCCCNKQKKILFEESKCISKHFNVTNKFEFDCSKI